MIDRDTQLRFRLKSDWAYFAGMVFSTHSHYLSAAIETHGSELDVEGYVRYTQSSAERRLAAMAALEKYFEVKSGWGAFTYSTTFGLAQVLVGMKMQPGQEVLTSLNEHPATVDTLKLRRDRERTPFRLAPLYQNSRLATEAEIVANVEAAIRPETRVLALAWVYSTDGVKLPIRKISDVVTRLNADRASSDRIIFVVDGVHGFGIEDSTFKKLGCDFLVAGLHKSFLGPRGTAVLCGTTEGWDAISPIAAALSGWNTGPADRHVPGGVKAYDHWWSLDLAFQLHHDLDKAAIESHIHTMKRDFSTRLARLPKVTIVTPDAVELSSGMICFDVAGKTPGEVLAYLKEKRVIATESALDRSAGRTHVRFSFSILNDTDDVERAMDALSAFTSSLA